MGFCCSLKRAPAALSFFLSFFSDGFPDFCSFFFSSHACCIAFNFLFTFCCCFLWWIYICIIFLILLSRAQTLSPVQTLEDDEPKEKEKGAREMRSKILMAGRPGRVLCCTDHCTSPCLPCILLHLAYVTTLTSRLLDRSYVRTYVRVLRCACKTDMHD